MTDVPARDQMRAFGLGIAAILLPSTFVATQVQARDCADEGAMHVTSAHVLPETSSAVMIDGVLSPGEWDGAVKYGDPLTGTVSFRRSASYLYVAVEFPEGAGGFADLFVSACGSTEVLHASAKLGERSVPLDATDWDWWNNVGWVANTTRVDSFEARTFLPAPVREFQIDLRNFPGRVWGLRVALTATGPDGRPIATINAPTTGEWWFDLGTP